MGITMTTDKRAAEKKCSVARSRYAVTAAAFSGFMGARVEMAGL